MAEVKTYTSEDMKFENLSKNHLALVDFWATWCGPCRMIAPIVEELAAETEGVTFAKVNVDENRELAMRYGIRGIPAFKLFRGGKVEREALGSQSRKGLEEALGL